MADTRAEKLRKLERGYRKSAGMDEEVTQEKQEEPGILDRIKRFGKDVMDKISEDIPENREPDLRLRPHQESIEREGIKTSDEMIPEGKEEGMGGEQRSRKMRKLILGLQRPRSA